MKRGCLRIASAVALLMVSTGAIARSYTVIKATDGIESQDAKYLFDNKTDTKWCTRFNDTVSVEFKISDTVMVDGYTITTGDDCEDYEGRNPTTWSLTASLDSVNWDTLHSVRNDATLEDLNAVKYTFRLPEATSKKYHYFKWTVTALKEDNIMQASEFALLSECKHTSLTYHAAETADCTHSTHAEYWKCNECGRLLSDTTSYTVITDYDSFETEKAWGHKFKNCICTVCGSWSTPYLNDMVIKVDDLLVTSKTDTIDGKAYPWVTYEPGEYSSDLTPGIMSSNARIERTCSQTELYIDSPVEFNIGFNWIVESVQYFGLTITIDGAVKVNESGIKSGNVYTTLGAGKHTLVAKYRNTTNKQGSDRGYIYNIRLDTVAESAITTKQDEHAKFSVSASKAKTGDIVKISELKVDSGFKVNRYVTTPATTWETDSSFYMPSEPVTVSVVVDTVYYVTATRKDTVTMNIRKTCAKEGEIIFIDDLETTSSKYSLYKLKTVPETDIALYSSYARLTMPKSNVTIIPLLYYTITFADYDGTVLKSEMTGEEEMPEAPSDPTREPKDGYTYVFKGWTSEIEAVTKDKVYMAVYDAIPATEVDEHEAESKKTEKRLVDGRVEIVTPEGSVFGANGGRIK